MEPFAVDGRVDLEQLHALLAAQAEYPTLDYKRACDLSDRKARAEFIKDAAAMMSNPDGGYVVIGVDGRGAAVGADLNASVFDSARLHDLLVKHLEGDVPLVSQHHPTEGGDIVVVYLGRRSDRLFPVVRADVTVPGPDGEEVVHLRAGDVYIRQGTKSRRWRSSDLPALLAPYAEGIREQEQQRYGRLVADLTARQRDADLAHGPISNVTWELPADTFTTAVTEMSRAGDERGLKVLLLQTQTAGKRLARQATAAETVEFTRLMDLLDRLTTCLGVGVTTGDDDLVGRSTRALHQIYLSLGVDGTPIAVVQPRIWLEIAARVLAAIALAVRLEEWRHVRSLTLRPVGRGYVFQSWLRHADVEASRSGQSSSFTDTGTVPGLLIAVARQRLTGIPALRPDLPEDDAPPPIGAQPAQDDDALDSVCQADFLWCVAAATRGRGVGECYPSFSSLFPQRTEPAIERLQSEPEIRRAVAPEESDEELTNIIRGIIDVARNAHALWW